METKRSLPKLALGALHMLNFAISDHRRRFYGMKPVRIELHPAVVYDVRSDMVRLYGYTPPLDQELVYRDVLIFSDPRVERPLMINCNNEVEYL